MIQDQALNGLDILFDKENGIFTQSLESTWTVWLEHMDPDPILDVGETTPLNLHKVSLIADLAPKSPDQH